MTAFTEHNAESRALLKRNAFSAMPRAPSLCEGRMLLSEIWAI
ncbi:MAG: hypothetical protein ACRETH_11575 [Steroidobacteraceae bacterium]